MEMSRKYFDDLCVIYEIENYEHLDALLLLLTEGKQMSREVSDYWKIWWSGHMAPLRKETTEVWVTTNLDQRVQCEELKRAGFEIIDKRYHHLSNPNYSGKKPHYVTVWRKFIK